MLSSCTRRRCRGSGRCRRFSVGFSTARWNMAIRTRPACEQENRMKLIKGVGIVLFGLILVGVLLVLLGDA